MGRSKKHKKIVKLVNDTIRVSILNFCMLAIFAILLNSFEIFTPFKKLFYDFDYTDLYFSEFRSDHAVSTDTRVVIINTGHLNNMQLGQKIKTIQKFNPQVIAVSNTLQKDKVMYDMFLRQTVKTYDNLIFTSDVNTKDDSIIFTNPDKFFGDDIKFAHTHFDTISMITTREFSPVLSNHDTSLNILALEAVKMYDSSLYDLFIKEAAQNEVINFRGGELPFIKLDFEEIVDTNNNLGFLKDKIVLMGYLKPDKFSSADLHESYFTPMKHSIEGFPDAKNIELQAHIVSMILNKEFLHKLSYKANMLIAFIISFFFIMFAIYLYVNKSKYFDVITKPLQFLIIILILWSCFFIFQQFGVKIDMVPTVICLILSLEVLYLYEETLELFKVNTYLTQNLNYKEHENKIIKFINKLPFINKF